MVTTPDLPMVRFPRPLRQGDLIAVTAPSSGVTGAALERLDLVLQHLRHQGFRVIEGRCLRQDHLSVSAPREERAAELWQFLQDPEVAAIFPPWGGELATEILELLDFDALVSATPKWLLGYSDLSTIQLPLTLLSGWATAHGCNLMDLAPTQTDPLTGAVMRVLSSDFTSPVLQRSASRYQRQWIDFAVQVDAPFNLTHKVEWKRLDGSTAPLDFAGHLLGGCLDTIGWLSGTRYGDVPSFVRRCGDRGAIVYLENVEMAPPALVRCLLSLRRQGWLDGLSGLMLGRSAAPDPESTTQLGYAQALRAALGDLACPVLYDVDIGHQPPQFTLINGAFANVSFEDGGGAVVQSAVPPSA
jgi:muramoyltetrapeptide carboxypeptidase LdcA involved in peptidoglycan recycling